MTPWGREPVNGSQSERQTLPSIQSITKGASPPPPPSQSGPSPSSSSNHSPTQSNTTGRDSGNWSMTTTSNHSSFSSPMTLAPISTDKPGRPGILNPEPPSDNNYYQSHGHGHSPSGSTLATNHSQTNLHTSLPPSSVLTSAYNHIERDNSPSASRRSSFDTRLGNLALNSPHSGTPAGSSQVSLASQLQRERSGGHFQGSPAPSVLEGHTSHSPFSPISPASHFPSNSISSNGSSNRNTYGSWTSANSGPPDRPGAKNAPPIVGSARYPYPHPNAPSPTKGFPYAFPDPDFAGPPAPGSRDGSSTTQTESRNGSMSGSQATSLHPKNPYGPQIDQYPPGPQPQASQTSLYSQTSNSTTGSHQVHPTFPQGSLQDLHHHHHLQRLNSSGTMDSPPSTPYSRTPELRVSHKLAERKRRKEMKELFDELRDSLPAERGGKSSKWEVLTKAIEYLAQVKQINENLSGKYERVRQDNERVRQDNERLNAELQSYRSGGQQGPQGGGYQNGQPQHMHQQPRDGRSSMSGYGGQPMHQGQQQQQQSQRLPSMPVDSNQMQGIERSY